jgi:hypothetical protein
MGRTHVYGNPGDDNNPDLPVVRNFQTKYQAGLLSEFISGDFTFEDRMSAWEPQEYDAFADGSAAVLSNVSWDDINQAWSENGYFPVGGVADTDSFVKTLFHRDTGLVNSFLELNVGPTFNGMPIANSALPPVTIGALTNAISTGPALLQKMHDSVCYRDEFTRGWRHYPSWIGSAGVYQGDFPARASIQSLGGICFNNVDEAVYIEAHFAYDGITEVELDGNTGDYTLTLDIGLGWPGALGFWSMTMYDTTDQNMVVNDLFRYAIRDQDILSGEIESSGPDQYQIYMSVDDPKFPVGSGLNWLPCPPGPFKLTLRFYVPENKEEALGFFPPIINRIASKRDS